MFWCPPILVDTSCTTGLNGKRCGEIRAYITNDLGHAERSHSSIADRLTCVDLCIPAPTINAISYSSVSTIPISGLDQASPVAEPVEPDPADGNIRGGAVNT